MYGDFTPTIVFGWHEKDRSKMLYPEWLYKYYGDINIYTTDVVRNYAGNILYGIKCQVADNGSIELTNGKRQLVYDIYHQIYACYDSEQVQTISSPGFYMGIYGGYENCHKFYIPGIGDVPSNYRIESDSDYEISEEKINYNVSSSSDDSSDELSYIGYSP